MKLQNISVSYFGIINPDVCEKIISLGLSKMNVAKSKGFSSTGITRNQIEKKDTNLNKDELSNNLIASDKTLQQINKGGHKFDKFNFRKSEVTGLSDKWLYDLFTPLINEANKKAGWNWQIDAAETFQFTVYEGSKENGGFYGWHTDGSSDFNNAYKPAIKISDNPLRFKQPKRNKENIIILDNTGKPEADMSMEDLPLNNNRSGLDPKFSDNMLMWGKVRKISMTVNLSDPKKYEGGNLKLDLGPHVKNQRYKICEDIRPKGSVIFFPSFTYHCVTPVTSGTRYSLVLWCLGKPWQ